MGIPLTTRSFFIIAAFVGILTLNQNGYTQPAKIQSIISENSLAVYEDSPLLMLDFWATWCGPCIPATQQLEIFQSTNKDKIFIVSISDEPIEKITKHLIKHPINLMVVADHEGYTVSKYNITSRPYGVVLNRKGNVVWEGHPSNLTQKTLEQLYKKAEKLSPRPFSKLIVSVTFEENNTPTDNDITINRHKQDNEHLGIANGKVTYTGYASKLLSIIKPLDTDESFLEEKLDRPLMLTCPETIWNTRKDSLLTTLLDYLHADYTIEEKEIDGIELKLVNKDLLWNSDQLVWEGNATNYFVGTDRLKADNVTISELADILTKIKGTFFFFAGDDTDVHDWDCHYQIDNLMQEDLEYSYGIILTPQRITIRSMNVFKRKKENER